MATHERFVKVLRPSDVLFGRGSGPNDHEGNIRFRSHVAERKEEYMATNHRMTKAKIAKEIVDKVYAANGRFLKKVEQSEMKSLGLPEGTECYEVVDDDTIMEKAKQALRQNTQKNKAASDSGATGKASPPPTVKAQSPPVPVHQHRVVPPINTSLDPSRVSLVDFEPLPISPTSFSSPESPSYSPAVAVQAPRQPTIAPSPVTVVPSQWNTSGMTPTNQQQQHHLQPNDMTRSQMRPRENDSMLSYVRQNAYAAQVKHPAPGALDASNLSMAQIPQDDVVGPRRSSTTSRRDSLDVGELPNLHGPRQGLDMNELMDSFSKMRTGEDRRMQSSVETMGTIEHINPESIADMSLGTMGSSTFSLFRGNESLAAMDDKIAQADSHVATEREPPTPPADPNFQTSYGVTGPSYFMSNNSMTMSDVWGSRRKSSSTMTTSTFATSREDHSGSSGIHRDSLLSFQPRPVVLMEEQPSSLDLDQMGASSMSVLKAAMTVNDGSVHHHEAENYYAGADRRSSRVAGEEQG